MYKIMVYEKLDHNRKSMPKIFEYHNTSVDASSNMAYLSSLFGKHYGFFITKDKLPVEEWSRRDVDT